MIRSLIFCLALFVAAPAFATDYHVATTGNNGNTGLSQAQAWATIVYAVSSSSPVAAGDTIHVHAGTYTGYVQIQKSGGNSTPIVLRPYLTDAVILTTGGALGNIFNDSYCNWYIGSDDGHGFEIKDSSGGAGVYFDQSSCTGTSKIQYNTIHNTDSGDNASCIFLQRIKGTVIVRNNTLYDCDGTGAFNSTGIVIFGHNGTGSPGVVAFQILNNEIYNEGLGIKIKHPFGTDQTVSIEIAYNLIHSYTDKGGVAIASGAHCADKTVEVHHNIINGGGNNIPGVNSGDDFPGSCHEFHHNTIYNVGQALYVCIDGGSGCLTSDDTNMHDNILVTIARGAFETGLIMLNRSTASTPFDAESDYNCYSQLTGSATSIFRTGSTDQTIAAWRTANGTDANSVNQAPTFEDAAGGDFHLTSGSTNCKNLRGDGHDAGAYELGTECIGVACDEAPAPSTTKYRLPRRPNLAAFPFLAFSTPVIH